MIEKDVFDVKCVNGDLFIFIKFDKIFGVIGVVVSFVFIMVVNILRFFKVGKGIVFLIIVKR